MGEKIGNGTVGKLQPSAIAWDGGKGAVSGFGARRQKGEAVVYFLKYRTKDGRQRWQKIGPHGSPWTPDTARQEAKRILREVADGNDPAAEKADARKTATVAELCDSYFEAAKAGDLLTRRRRAKKASTLATDEGRIERHIKPILGSLKVATVTREDIERFQTDVIAGKTAARVKTGKHGLARVTGGQGTATRTMGLLGAIFQFAVKKKLLPDNPVRGVQRHGDGKRERRLSDAEYLPLGEALRTMPDSTWPVAMSATKFLALTGWRRGEALCLRWTDVDLAKRTARLAETKTGASMRPLSHATCEVLSGMPRFGDFVFPASAGPKKADDFDETPKTEKPAKRDALDKPVAGYHKVWLRIAKQAGFGADITPHVLRHSFASVADDLEFSELTIAALIGHKKQTMTSRYTHKADAVLLGAAGFVSDRIFELMGEGRRDADVIPIRRVAL